MIYISYDRFPTTKGASIHINAFVRALADAFGEVKLATVPADTTGETTAATTEYCPGVVHTPLPALGRNLIERTIYFRRQLRSWLDSTLGASRADVIHVRSIFEGYSIAREKERFCDKFVYEVNGLPSIELKYHYPDVADDAELLQKLETQERFCLRAADLIVTVSPVNAGCLIRRGADPRKIRVIPNGVDTDVFTYQPPRAWDDREIRMLYSGTMSSWQGVLVAIEALALYRRDHPARLTLVGEARGRQKKEIERRCYALEVSDFVELLEPMSQQQLCQLHHDCDVSLAPLKANDRNLVQGCCPLKVLEAMASGTPLIASDMPVVQTLARGGVDALLVRPGSPKAIKDAMLRLRVEPHLAGQLSASARRRVKQTYTWRHAQEALILAYREVLGM